MSEEQKVLTKQELTEQLSTVAESCSFESERLDRTRMQLEALESRIAKLEKQIQQDGSPGFKKRICKEQLSEIGK